MKKTLGLRIIIAFAVLNFNLTAYAGDINGNEQSVIAVAGSQFEYNGEQYQAKQEYMSALRQYLARDDVDLTADQAQAAISQIYANVKTGVDGGYLEKIGGDALSSSDKSAVASTDASSDSTQTVANSPNEAGSTLSQDSVSESTLTGSQTGDITTESVSEGTGLEEGKDIARAMEDQELEHKVPEAAKAQPQVELIYLEKVGGEVEKNIASGAQITDSLNQSLPDNEYMDFYKLTLFPSIMLKVLPYLSIVSSVVIILLTITVLMKRYYAKHHHGRYRKPIKGLRFVLIGLMFVLISSTLVMTTLALSEYQDSVVTRNLDNTQYYEYIYDRTIEAVSDIYSGIQMPEKDIIDCVAFDKVTIAAKKQLEKDLHQGTYSTNAELLIHNIENHIRNYLHKEKDILMTVEANRGLSILTDQLNARFEEILKWDFALFWSQQQKIFWSMAKWLFPLNIFLVVICHILLIALHHFKYRGVRKCGVIIGTASLVLLLSGLLMKFLKNTYVLKAAANLPIYEQEFYQLFIKENAHVILMIGMAGILVGMGYTCLSKVIKEGVK